jgi:hypothetical protein
MANHTGSEGAIKIGANTVAEVRSFGINISADTTEDTIIGDTAKTFKLTQYEWDADIDVFWDEADTTGQGAMTIGSTVSITLGPEGVATTDMGFAGSAIVTSIGHKVTHNGMVETSIKVKGTGALTIAAL